MIQILIPIIKFGSNISGFEIFKLMDNIINKKNSIYNMYILLLIGIILYFLINNYDTFSIGVPYCKIFRMEGDKYLLVNMDDFEPEPQDIEPIFNSYVDDTTYQIMEETQRIDITINPAIIFTAPVDSDHTRTGTTQSNDQILKDLFKNQLVSNGFFTDVYDSATIEARRMVESTKLTYQNLIDYDIITREEAMVELSRRPDILRRFRSDPQIALSGMPLNLPRLPKECAAMITSFIEFEYDFDILTQHFNPVEYIDFINGILTNLDITFDDFNKLLDEIYNMDIFTRIYIRYISPIIIRNNIDTALNLFTQFLELSQILIQEINQIVESNIGAYFQIPYTTEFLSLLENGYLGPDTPDTPDTNTFDLQYIIDNYIDIDIGLLQRLFDEIRVNPSLFRKFPNIESIESIDALRIYLINPNDNYRNIHSMISNIIEILYEIFNSGR
jgi:hypothetical protein